MAFILPTCIECSTRAIKINVDTISRHEKCTEHKLRFNATTSTTAQETLLLEENRKHFYKTARNELHTGMTFYTV